jgi:hypothetical protein
MVQAASLPNPTASRSPAPSSQNLPYSTLDSVHGMLTSLLASGWSVSLQASSCFLPQYVHGLPILKFPGPSLVAVALFGAYFVISVAYLSFFFSGDASRCPLFLGRSCGDCRRSLFGDGRLSNFGDGLRSGFDDGCLSTLEDGRHALSLDLPFGLSRHLATFGYFSSRDLACFWVIRE